jgi:hypothetical protein
MALSGTLMPSPSSLMLNSNCEKKMDAFGNSISKPSAADHSSIIQKASTAPRIRGSRARGIL